MNSARRLLLLPVACLLCALLASGSPITEAPDQLIRQANAAFLRGDKDTAESLYAAAEERTADPGLVAFNKAAVLFQQEKFHDAELLYACVLNDKECPADRAARAWFNRGNCLLRRGGGPGVYRSAVACFERCLDLKPTDEAVKANAPRNLELAKLLWFEANRKAAQPDNLSNPPPELESPAASQTGGADNQPGPPETVPGSDGSKEPRPIQQPAPGQMPKNGATQTDQKTAGNNANLPVIGDNDTPQHLSPEATREYLKRTDVRLRDERAKMLRMLYGPDRPGVRDW